MEARMAQIDVGARGERTLTVGEKAHTILLTNRALAEAERALGKSVMQVARDGISERVSITDIAKLLQVGLDAARRDQGLPGRAMPPDDAWGILDVLGFGTVAGAVLEALSDVLFYNPEREDGGPPA